MQSISSDAPLEIERKRQFTGSLDALLAVLRRQGFQQTGDCHEIDTYYSRPDVDFMQTVECLRIRRRDDFAEITYKPATTGQTRTADNVTVKPETNLPIRPQDVATAQQLFANLGMVKLSDVDKRRRSFTHERYPEATVVIDIIGDTKVFIETEVITTNRQRGLIMMANIEAQLGIDTFDIVTQPYRDLSLETEVSYDEGMIEG